MPRNYRIRSGLETLACLLVAAAISTALIASVVVLFDSVSNTPWLASTPQNLALAARCDGARSAAARRQCLRDAVETKKPSEQQVARVVATP